MTKRGGAIYFLKTYNSNISISNSSFTNVHSYTLGGIFNIGDKLTAYDTIINTVDNYLNKVSIVKSNFTNIDTADSDLYL